MINGVDIAWVIANFIFDFCVILFDVPAYVWYGWLEVLRTTGQCGPQTNEGGLQYDIWAQLYLGLLFYISLVWA